MQKAIIIISVLFLVGCQNQSEEKDKKDILRIADSLKKDKYNIIGSFRELPQCDSSSIEAIGFQDNEYNSLVHKINNIEVCIDKKGIT